MPVPRESALATARLVPEAFSKDAETALAARRAMTALHARVVPEELPWLDQVVRSTWRDSYMRDVIRSFVRAEEFLRSAGEDGAAMLAFLSFHPIGYIREEAVSRLADSREGWELPYLLVRLNDWVREVREKARAAVLRRIREESLAELARSVFLLTRLAHVRRGVFSDVREAALRLLASDRGRAAMREVVRHGSRATARAATRFLLDHGADVIETGLLSEDHVIRAWVTPMVVRALPPEEARATLLRLTNDSSPVVRRESLRGLAESFPEESVQALRHALLDRSASVRETARHLLRNSGVDFAAVSRNAIDAATTSRPLASALAALAEVGERADAQRAVAHLSHSSTLVRRVALKCVMRLDGDAFAERVSAMLQDASSAVSAAARDALRAHVAILGPARLEELFNSSSAQHVQRNAILLMAALPKWQSIACLLRASVVANDVVASLARERVRVWNRYFNRNQAIPSRRAIEEINAALTAASASLDERTVVDIQFSLRPFESI